MEKELVKHSNSLNDMLHIIFRFDIPISDIAHTIIIIMLKFKKDFSDGMNLQCFASFVFLYFAVLTPIITFGGLLGDATDNNIAVVESLVGACIAGILFHMFAGQPLTIIGSTGPILIFERISFAMTIKLGLDYLEFRHRLTFSSVSM